MKRRSHEASSFTRRPIADGLKNLTFPVPQEETPSGLFAFFHNFENSEVTIHRLFCEPTKKEQLDLVRTIGSRMRDARELCNMSQLDAARRLGYENSSKLAKVEGASDTHSVPLYLIPRAAKLYDVSTDFLLGLTSDWERNGGEFEDRDYGSFLLRTWEQARSRDLGAMAKLYARVKAVAPCLEKMISGATEIAAALYAVRLRGGEFDDLPAGNRLLCAIEKHADSARNAEASLRRFRAELTGQSNAG